MSAVGELRYVVAVLVLFLTFGSVTAVMKAYLDRNVDPDAALLLSPAGKLEHLRRHADEYDLIFYGDSRTYIGVDPRPTTEATGLRAFNYGSMAHWFPTQYPQLKRMVPYLGGKCVVWLIGDINFSGLQGSDDQVNRGFPLTPAEFVEYWRLGFNPSHLTDNLLLNFVSSYFIAFAKDVVQARLQSWLAAPAVRFAGVNRLGESSASGESALRASDSGSRTALERQVIDRAHAAYPDIFEEKFEDGVAASRVLYSVRRRSGQMAYFEVDSAYLRARQEEFAAEISPSAAVETADPRQLAIFQRMLDEFGKSGARLIVVDYLDAPFHYRFPENRRARDEFMKSIEEKVTASGFTYLRPDMSDLRDEHYFDYNHLNYEGSRRYSRTLARALAGALR